MFRVVLLFYCKTGGTNILLVRPAYSYSIVLIVLIMFVLKALINLYVRSEYWSGHGLTCLGGSPSLVLFITSLFHSTGCHGEDQLDAHDMLIR